MSDWPHDNRYTFSAPLSTGDEATHEVYVKGSGPPILLLQEMPGIGPETLSLADRLVGAGFTIYLPHLLGTFGKLTPLRVTARLFCVRREFKIFARGRQSPIAGWMCALARDIRDRESAEGIGVIGMCLTGSFALTLMADDAVLGGVASQPSLPVLGGDHLHMSQQDIYAARTGMARSGPGLALRFGCDRIATARHMRALKKAFGDDLLTKDYPGKDHSLLTLDFHDPAYQRVEAYFAERFASITAQAPS
ncbi:dienelactone hydrolase family protein [Ruegeria sp. 2205SS24-7]|uniref:dienelactone hydrolase family protein n=1 Tax=Ruegeria discodermiae TaxID=3064389 RepID=UPI002741DA98|nr:dienelactone hydrolase family protein [Ruegeria sp. 2205SS24-7]MDP5217787.1 dienelactone hydrolase family protein [Ruegeria sp. 2205SS24-7]